MYGEAEEDVLECTEMIAGTVFAGYKVTLMFEQEKTWQTTMDWESDMHGRDENATVGMKEAV